MVPAHRLVTHTNHLSPIRVRHSDFRLIKGEGEAEGAGEAEAEAEVEAEAEAEYSQ